MHPRYQRHAFVYLLFLFMALFAQGCSSLGYENVDTTRKAILVANAEVRAANLLLQDLIQTEQIGREDAARALGSLQNAKNQLETANDLLNLVGDPAGATSSLERARVALNLAITLLSTMVEN